VAGVDPASNRIASLLGSNLGLRILSSLVLAPLALATAYWGGLAFLVFWSVAGLLVLWEWDTLVCAHDKHPVLILGVVTLVGAALLLAFESPGTAAALGLLGVLGITTLASNIRRWWCAAGLIYAGALQVAPVLLRTDATWGFAAIVFLFIVVWGTDIAAYFAGRALGGAKLMPQVSPGKTWSGAAGGTAAGVIGGVAVAHYAGAPNLAAIGLVALVLSIGSQVGDLLESAVKRRFNAKDASTLLPGHGGLMDRLDGFLVAVVVALLIGVARGGVAAPGRGLMVW
jgi:phosphatidate cytidylyltransferase